MGIFLFRFKHRLLPTRYTTLYGQYLTVEQPLLHSCSCACCAILPSTLLRGENKIKHFINKISTHKTTLLYNYLNRIATTNMCTKYNMLPNIYYIYGQYLTVEQPLLHCCSCAILLSTIFCGETKIKINAQQKFRVSMSPVQLSLKFVIFMIFCESSFLYVLCFILFVSIFTD